MAKRTDEDREGRFQPRLGSLLLGFIAALVFILLVLSAVLGFMQFREHLAARLQFQAENAATALGLSLSNAIDGRDRAAAATLINALFDRGNYRQVLYTGLDGGVIVRRTSGSMNGEAPQWFRRWVPMPAPRGTADVVRGWQQLGRILVEVDPTPAYEALWQGTRRSILGFVLVGALAVLLASRGLRLLLRPLEQLQQQALQLRGHRFDARVPIPRTRELAGLAHVTNRMAEEVEHLVAGQIRLIEDLRRQTHQDPVTGLENRLAFDQRLRAEVESREAVGSGFLALIAPADFAAFNQNQGYQAGDRLLVAFAEHLRAFAGRHPGSFLARRQGAEFTVFVPGANLEDAYYWLMELEPVLTAEYIATGLPSAAVDIGFTPVAREDRATEILARADAALTAARGAGVGGTVRSHGPETNGRGGQYWRVALGEALERERLQLLMQPMMALDGVTPWFQQVLARLEVDREWVSAGEFLPQAERFGFAVPLDRLILRQVLAHLSDGAGGELCIVFSTCSVADADFRQEALAALRAAPTLAGRLWLAVHEDAVRQQATALDEFIPLLHQCGVRVLIDRFGAGGVSFDYLQRWRIDGVRIDRGFVRNLPERPDARFFIESIAPVVHSRGARVFAAGVETAAEWTLVQTLPIDGAIGYHLALPSQQSGSD